MDMVEGSGRSLIGYWLAVGFLALLPLPLVGLADQVVSLDPERPAQVVAVFAAGNAAAFLSERLGGPATPTRLGVGAFLAVSMAVLALALAAMPFVNVAFAQAGLRGVASSPWTGLVLRWWASVVGCLLLAGLVASFEPRHRKDGRGRGGRVQSRPLPMTERRFAA